MELDLLLIPSLKTLLGLQSQMETLRNQKFQNQHIQMMEQLTHILEEQAEELQETHNRSEILDLCEKIEGLVLDNKNLQARCALVEIQRLHESN
jgi:hypothetical protein